MGITTAINGILLALGPSFALYYACDLSRHKVYLHVMRAFGSFLFAQIAKTIILAIISIYLDSLETPYPSDAPVWSLNRLQLVYSTVLTVCVEFTMLAKLMAIKEYDNKQARLVAMSIGWACASTLISISDKVLQVAFDDQVSYMLLINGVSALIQLASSIALIYLIDKLLSAYKDQDNWRLNVVIAILIAAAGLNEITSQKEAHEVRVNTWNQGMAFMLRHNSNYLYLQERTYFDVTALKLALCVVLWLGNLLT